MAISQLSINYRFTDIIKDPRTKDKQAKSNETYIMQWEHWYCVTVYDNDAVQCQAPSTCDEEHSNLFHQTHSMAPAEADKPA